MLRVWAKSPFILKMDIFLPLMNAAGCPTQEWAWVVVDTMVFGHQVKGCLESSWRSIDMCFMNLESRDMGWALCFNFVLINQGQGILRLLWETSSPKGQTSITAFTTAPTCTQAY